MPILQQHITVQMFRKPTAAAYGAAKGKGHEPPPPTPLGTFQLQCTTVDKTRQAARTEAARRLKVHPSRLIVNFQAAGVSRSGEEQRAIVVYAPAEDEKGVA